MFLSRHMIVRDSSVVSEIGYQSDTETLYVRFLATGDWYKINDVGSYIAGELMAAESVGNAYARLIRDKFEATKLEEAARAKFRKARVKISE